MSAPDEFTFLDPGELSDGELTLVLERCSPADPVKGWVPAYVFKMCAGDDRTKVGEVSFRAGTTPALERFGGHLGYGVDPEHRGRHFAERACRMLFPFIRRHGFEEIWITCNPDNTASRRTCERLGAEMVEIVLLPEESDMFAAGDRAKCRYRLRL